MDENVKKELQELAENNKKSIDALKDAVNTKTEGFVAKAEFIKLEEKNEKLEESLRTIGAELATVKAAGSNGSVEKSELAKAVEENQEAYKQFKAKAQPFEFETKAAGTMLTSTNLDPTPNSYLPVPQIDTRVIPIQRATPLVMDYADVATTDSARLVFINEKAGEGDAAMTAEGGTKPLLDVDFQSVASDARKIAVAFKVSEEMLDDIPFMQSEIDRIGREKLLLALDANMLTGNGTAPNLSGITTLVPGYTITSLDDSVNNANNFDALVAAATQIRTNNFEPNVVFVNPVDYAKMLLTKSTTDEYVVMQLQLQNGQVLNMRIVQSNQITAGSFLMGDMKALRVRIYRGLKTIMGWENDDLRKNLRTIILEMRVHQFLSANQYAAFVYDAFADVKTALETP